MKKIFTLLVIFMAMVTSASAEADNNDYLCFTAGEGGTKVSFEIKGLLTTVPMLQYSTDDKKTWYNYNFIQDNAKGYKPAKVSVDVITLKAGEKVYFRAGDGSTTTNTSFCQDADNYIKFISTGKVAASGNVMSLLDASCKATEVPAYAFSYLFNGCENLSSAPELPATTLAEGCYSFMFRSCTNLETAPELPATTLAKECYSSMFYSCTALAIAPTLPATTLAESCYDGMFSYCAALTTAPELPATTLAKGCYCNMFNSCTALTVAPELPATTLTESCYKFMFVNCTKLNTLKAGFDEWGDEHSVSTYYWLYGVPAEGTFTCPEGLDVTTTDVSHVPAKWTVKTIDPVAYAAIVKIMAIGTVEYTKACEAKINAARAAYNALTTEQKSQVFAATLKALTDAETKFAALERENGGKFVMITTFENADGTSKETIKAQVSKDFEIKVTLPAKDAKVYANKVTTTATMSGITTLGMKEDESRTYSKTFTSSRQEEIIPGEYFKNFYNCIENTDVAEKHFTVTVGENLKIKYTVNAGMENGKAVMVATPDNAAIAYQAWSEICSRIQPTIVAENQIAFCPKKGSFIKNNNEIIGVIKDFTYGDTLSFYANIEGFNKNTWCEDDIDAKYIGFGIAPESSLTIGKTCLTVKKDHAIEVTIDDDAHDVFVPGTFLSDIWNDQAVNLNEYKEGDPELNKQLIKDILGYMQKIDAAVVGKKNVTIAVKFDRATAISNVNASTSSAQADGKFIENGRVVIVKNGMKFNANGQRLK